MTKLKSCCIVNLEHVFQKTIQEDDTIIQNRKSFLVTAENFDGNSSANTTIKKPQNSTATTQSNKPVTQTMLPSVAETQLNNRGIAAVTADYDDDFLRGFNADDRDAQVRFQPHPYTPPQTTTQATSPSAEYKSLKPLNNRGITQVTADDFLRGFNKGYEENEIATAPEHRDPSFWDLTVNSYKQGYNNAARGKEAWKSMHGQKNELDKYNELLSSDEYNFETDDWWEKILSGASQQVGQWVRQLSDPDTLALAMGSGGAALLAGQAGPQALLPEEVLTVPGAFALGMKAGNAKTNMEIEGGNAYLEMLENGVSEETARAIATGVGGINALLETAQLDELLKAYKVLGKAGADDAFLDVVLRELKNRGIDTVTETLQEDLQELVTIGGTQLGSKIDTGEWAYNLAEVLQRLWDTTKESALTFGLTNIPSTVHNVGTQNHNRLVAAGKANILAGKMPTAEQLQAMNMSESEALGKMAMLQMDGTKQADSNNAGTGLDQVESLDDFVTVPQHLAGITGQDLHDYLVAREYDVQPLSRGSFKGIPFEDGGGFKVNWGGDRILQYHPAKSSHHGSAYFKISSGETGTIRIDMDGNIIK